MVSGIQDDSPIAFYRLNETGGATTAAALGNPAMNATYVGSPTQGVTGSSPMDPTTDTAVTFSGTGQAVRLDNLSGFGSSLSKFTVELVFKTTSTAQGVLFGSTNVGTTTAFQIQMNTAAGGTPAAGWTRFVLRAEDGNYYNAAFNNAAVYSGQYVHVVVAYRQASGLQAYVNGSPQAITVGLNTITTTSSFVAFTYPPYLAAVNDRGTVTDYADATIDAAAFYTAVVPPAAVLSHFRAGASRLAEAALYDNPLAYYRLAETGTTTANEIASPGLSGTYVGSPTLGVSSASALDALGDYAATFNGTSQALRLDHLASLGSALPTFGLELVLKTTSSGQGVLVGAANTGFTTALSLQLNTNAAGNPSAGATRFFLRADDGTSYAAAFTNAALYSGKYVHLVINYTRGTGTSGLTVYVNGVAQTLSYSVTTITGASTFSNFAFVPYVAANNNRGTIANYAAATVDEVAFYSSPLPAAAVIAHYEALAQPAFPTETLTGTLTSPAVGPQPSFGIGGPDAVLVRNWHFGANGTIQNQSQMNAEFQYHDQFNTYNNGGNYGASTVAPDAANAIGAQPVEITNCPPVREFFTNSLKTYIQPLNGVTTIDPVYHTAGCGSFQAKWNLPNGGSYLGQDIIWETRVRYVTPKYFWFALWTSGNIWHSGAEQDLMESFGYLNPDGSTNYDGRYWHADAVPRDTQAVTYSNWGLSMAAVGVPPFDAAQYHIWTWVYKQDGSWAMYVDGIQVQRGVPYAWTLSAMPDGQPVDLDFIFDAGWGHNSVASVKHTMPISELNGCFYEWNYSRVYLAPTTSAPAVPTTVNIASENGGALLDWDFSAAATSYDVFRGTTPGGEGATPINATPVKSGQFADTGLTNGVTYYYKIRAVNSVGASAQSAEVSITPTINYTYDNTSAAFTIVGMGTVIYPGNYGTNFISGGSTNAGTTRTATVTPSLPSSGNYEIFTRAPAESRWAVIPVTINHAGGSSTVLWDARKRNNFWVSLGVYTFTAGTGSLSVSNTGLANGAYLVADAFRWVPTSAVIPATPTGLGASAINAGQINLAWTAVAGASSYNVKRATVAGGPYATVSTGIGGTSFSDVTLKGGTTYYYTVTAVATGTESRESTAANATTPAGTVIASAPTALAATTGNATVWLGWNASIGAASYTVKRSDASGGPYTVVASGVLFGTYTDRGLINGKTYYYVVTAVNAAGESAASNQFAATPVQSGF